MPLSLEKTRFTQIITFLFFILLFGVKSSANENFNIVDTTLSAYVEDMTVTSMAKGAHGEIYLATQEGLYVFDGRDIELAIDSSKKSGNIGESSISKTLVSKNGNVWFSSNTHGIHYIAPETGVVVSPMGLSDLRGRFIRNLKFDQDGNLWITDESDVWKYELIKDRLVPAVFQHRSALGRIRSNTLAVDAGGSVWLGTDMGLWRVPRGEKAFVQVLNIGLSTVNNGKDDEIVAFSNAGSLIRISINTHSILSRSPSLQQEYLSATGVELIENKYILSSDEGLFIFNSALENTGRFTTENSQISNDHVTGMTIIDESLYISTFRGVSTAVFTPIRWFDQQNSGIDNEVLSITESKDKIIWVGTYGGIYSRATNEATHYSLTSRSQLLSTDEIRAMAVSVKNDYALIGTWESGLIQTKLDRSNRPLNFSIESEILQPGSITNIFYLGEKTVWVGNYEGKLSRYYSNNGHISANESIPFLLLDGPILNISKVSAFKLFVATEKKLYRVSTDLSDFQEVELEFEDSGAKPTILSFHINQAGEIWLGTLNEGIYKSSDRDSIDQDSVSFTKVSHPRENHTFYAIESAETGEIWTSSNSGIVVFGRFAGYKGTVGKRDGLKSLDFNQGASLKDSHGNLYFGGSNGYTVFNPSDMNFERKPSPMLLTGLDIAGDNSIPSTALPYLRNVEISYRDRFITFMFNVIDYFDASQSRYRYMLEGFDPDWVEAGDRDSATFTNLPAGRYVFRAQGSNSDGVWNREGISINLIVHPAPWRTWWAYAIYLVLLAALVWSLKKTYDTYMLKEKATAIAETMNRAVEDAMDDIQEQLENQDTLVKRFHQRNLDTLDLLAKLQEPEWPGNRGGNLPALEALESTLSYQGDQLLFDLQACTNRIIAKVLAANPAQSESLNTILDIPNLYLPASLGSYLAIALYEITSDAVANLPKENGPGNYIQIAITATDDQSVQLTVQTNIPADLRDGTDLLRATRQRHHLDHLEKLLDRIGATLEVERNKYDRVIVMIPQPGFTSQATT